MKILEKFREVMAADVERPAPAAVWYDDPGTPEAGTWWWAVEHEGHPAFYLRALLAGDFAPGRHPAPRHALGLDGGRPDQAAPLRCGTCGEVPRPEDLEPVERTTGDRGHLGEYRARRVPWPRPTDPGSCWLCSDAARRTTSERETPAGRVRLCDGCAKHVDRGRGTTPELRERR